MGNHQHPHPVNNNNMNFTFSDHVSETGKLTLRVVCAFDKEVTAIKAQSLKMSVGYLGVILL